MPRIDNTPNGINMLGLSEGDVKILKDALISHHAALSEAIANMPTFETRRWQSADEYRNEAKRTQHLHDSIATVSGLDAGTTMDV